MSTVPLKTRNKVIISYINGRKLEDISFEEKIGLNAVEDIVNEWKQGYLNTEVSTDIAPELRDLAILMRDKEISIHDVVEGYHYYKIFKEKDRERVIRIVNELYSFGEDRLVRFLKTAEKMLSFAKYENIDYVDIPKAVEDMVEKGKEMNREIKSKEILNLELANRIQASRKEVEKLEEQRENYRREIDLANYLKQELPDGKEDDNAIRNVVQALKHSDFGIDKIREVAKQTTLIKNRDLTLDQFLKISRYFEELMNLGLKVQTMEKLLQQVKEYDMDIEEYLNERALYVKDKQSYTRSIKELVDTHKKIERQIKVLNEEIALKKLKLGKP